MKESGFYPAGAEFDSKAPYNELNIPEREFEIDVELVLRKKTIVRTDDYLPRLIKTKVGRKTIEVDSTEDTDWKAAFENSHYTIPELLQELKRYIEQDLERYKGNKRFECMLKGMLEDCNGWTVDEEYYEES